MIPVSIINSGYAEAIVSPNQFPLKSLPKDLLFMILSCLDFPSVLQLGQTDRFFRDVVVEAVKEKQSRFIESFFRSVYSFLSTRPQGIGTPLYGSVCKEIVRIDKQIKRRIWRSSNVMEIMQRIHLARARVITQFKQFDSNLLADLFKAATSPVHDTRIGFGRYVAYYVETAKDLDRVIEMKDVQERQAELRHLCYMFLNYGNIDAAIDVADKVLSIGAVTRNQANQHANERDDILYSIIVRDCIERGLYHRAKETADLIANPLLKGEVHEKIRVIYEETGAIVDLVDAFNFFPFMDPELVIRGLLRRGDIERAISIVEAPLEVYEEMEKQIVDHVVIIKYLIEHLDPMRVMQLLAGKHHDLQIGIFAKLTHLENMIIGITLLNNRS